MENASRSADVPPSQGGRYGGFGNPNCKNRARLSHSTVVQASSAPQSPEKDFLEDPMASITKGFGWFTSNASTAMAVLGTKVQEGAVLAAQGAGTLSTKLNETVIKPTTSAIQDPNFTNNVSSYVSGIGQKVSAAGTQGYSYASKWISETSGMTEGSQRSAYQDRYNGSLPGQEHFSEESQPYALPVPSDPEPKKPSPTQEEWQDF